ncbi:hypothetical protein EW093_02200 [Thiospirochaeta perfilievii]|uniref:Uncharacterized protein n=1 Tax=Thiospirochaeta perfilievii TaxID=252967 RepID=A0A5C1Q9I3_9SPIO|nr:hypothetical protein [Thiospirochaeta perfilievii]MBN2617878.1 hypothetical protein [Spirochaetales bacterium]QEN03559.1 hypothetical protein EW093_02200 [Thiospirochaeta perfilievii]
MKSISFNNLDESEMLMIDGGRTGGSIINDSLYELGNKVGSAVTSTINTAKSLVVKAATYVVNKTVSQLPGYSRY